MSVPLELYQGPGPIRSRALTAGCPLAAVVLRYARHVRVAAPAAPDAFASAAQCASAPASPPRLAPSPLPTLVTKKPICVAAAPPPPPRAPRPPRPPP